MRGVMKRNKQCSVFDAEHSVPFQNLWDKLGLEELSLAKVFRQSHGRVIKPSQGCDRKLQILNSPQNAETVK